MHNIRRRQLIDATIATIEAHGFADATIARISRTAGLSSGIISHYFGGKDALLEATMRSLLTELQGETIYRLRRAGGDPVARIEAVVGANFAERQFTPRVTTAWLAFYGQVPHSTDLARLHGAYVARLRSNLRHAFGQLLTAPAADRAAAGMASMIDGIWVRAALTPGPTDIDTAHALADDYLRMTLGHHGGWDGASRATERANPM
jgi:TetR/AcrR family transcriptional repressor of bet genes